NNGTIGVESAALFEENTALHRQGHLVRAMVTEYYIQAENVFRRQKRLQNSTTNPRALLQGLIQDGFVEKDDIERLSLLAFLLGWEKQFTLEDLEFEGLLFGLLRPLDLCMGHLESLMDPSEPPMVPTLVKKSTSKSKPQITLSTFYPLCLLPRSLLTLGNEGPPPDEAASEEESDDGAVVQGSAGRCFRWKRKTISSRSLTANTRVALLLLISNARDPSTRRSRVMFQLLPRGLVCLLGSWGRVTSAPQIASDSSADVIPPKQLAKQSKTAGPSQMRVVVPQTTTTQLRRKLFKKPKTHQAEGSSSKTKLLASARIAFQPPLDFKHNFDL
ncbi:hypothetical protein BT96DRAFT_951478, partial [Gymnopus androsaceus JB14]